MIASSASKSSLGHKALILMYHSVTETASDPWSLCVTPQHFADQMDVVRRQAHPVRLRSLANGLGEGEVANKAVVITFDDGYANNLHNAKPFLERYEVPATIFLASGYLGASHEFWWDELESLLLGSGRLPNILQLRVDGKTETWKLDEGVGFHGDIYASWRAWTHPPTSRHSLYTSLWRLLQRLQDEVRQSILAELRAWANMQPETKPTHRPLSLDEVSRLVEGDLINIGSHSVTHAVLSTLPLATQRAEIQRSKTFLEELVGRTVTSFAYPYGSEHDYTADTVALVREARFDCACSTLPTVVTKDTDCYQLPRLQVQDWNGDEFARQLSMWFRG
jgi:peptidoglycan/xylan/chitin deacetylase (PgdA/CDA1 family)